MAYSIVHRSLHDFPECLYIMRSNLMMRLEVDCAFRFEEFFVRGKDYDPDRQRANERYLKRRVIREKRGAVRELRKDAAFMAAERDKEKSRVKISVLWFKYCFFTCALSFVDKGNLR